jgi:RNA polymerase sigma factor (TIGR02999 family)
MDDATDGQTRAPSDQEPPPAPRSAEEWFAIIYHELRRMARGELFRHQALSLGAMTLLHETWLRLEGGKLEFATQHDLVRYAARVMRGIVIDYIRKNASLKRGAEFQFIRQRTFDDLRALDEHSTLNVNESLNELANIDPRLAELVELKFFAGLSFIEIAALRRVSDRTVQRDWEKARMLLFSSLSS